jgi:hypothetical protein
MRAHIRKCEHDGENANDQYKDETTGNVGMENKPPTDDDYQT